MRFTDPSGNVCYDSGPRAGGCYEGADGEGQVQSRQEEELQVTQGPQSVAIYVNDASNPGLGIVPGCAIVDIYCSAWRVAQIHIQQGLADGRLDTFGNTVCPAGTDPKHCGSILETANSEVLLGRPNASDDLALSLSFEQTIQNNTTGRLPTSTSGCKSFSADTEVLMADGTTKPISDITVGDQVWALDPETGEAGPRTVTAIWPHQDLLIEFTVDGGTITTTEDHHFWNHTDNQWQQTQHIDPGDLLLTPNGFVTAGTLNWTTTHRAPAFDLTIEDIHTYFVSAGNTHILVHNCGGMLGEGGPQFTSKTLTTRPGYRIDVENPNPGGRPGQLHLQAGSAKYLYDFDAGVWVGLPRNLQRVVASDPAVARAIVRARQYLGLNS
jgi:hypothetical protein